MARDVFRYPMLVKKLNSKAAESRPRGKRGTDLHSLTTCWIGHM